MESQQTIAEAMSGGNYEQAIATHIQGQDGRGATDLEKVREKNILLNNIYLYYFYICNMYDF